MRFCQILLLVALAVVANSCSVTFWKDADYNGFSQTFTSNVNDMPYRIAGEASSLTVEAGCAIIGYSEPSFNGDRSYFDGTISHLSGPYRFNDKIHSFKILDLDNYDCAVVMYSDSNFGGNANFYSTQTSTVFHNDYYSSLKIVGRNSQQCAVVAYRDASYGGDNRYFPSDESSLGDFGDRISSLKIVKKSACAVVMYSDSRFRGPALYYNQSQDHLGSHNDYFSSFKVLGDFQCVVTMFRNSERPAGGDKLRFTGGSEYAHMPDGWNDSVSSIGIGSGKMGL